MRTPEQLRAMTHEMLVRYAVGLQEEIGRKEAALVRKAVTVADLKAQLAKSNDIPY